MLRGFSPTQRMSIGHHAERGRAFDVLLDGRRIREELGFEPKFPRLADAIAAGA